MNFLQIAGHCWLSLFATFQEESSQSVENIHGARMQKMCFASKRRGATCTVHSRSTQSTNGQGILSTWSYQASMTNSMHLNRRSVGVRFSVFYGFLRYPLDYFPQTNSNQSLKVDRWWLLGDKPRIPRKRWTFWGKNLLQYIAICYGIL